MRQHPFLQNLPVLNRFAEVTDPDRYRPLAADWFVAVTDVTDSTAAIESGRYKDVNILGAAVIVGCMNAAGRQLLPYSFGGDGALVCVPPELAPAARVVLARVREIARDAYGLEMRVGLVPVARIQGGGRQIRVARLQLSEDASQTVFSGGGIAYAEEVLKAEPLPEDCRVDGADGEADFSGLECRWQEVSGGGRQTVALLVKALGEGQAQVYREVVARVAAIYGEDPHPLGAAGLRLSARPSVLGGELRLRGYGRGRLARLLYLLRVQAQVLLGRGFMALGYRSAGTDWSRYKADLIAHADYRKYDDMLRMVIAGTPQQHRQLEACLQALRGESRLAFGLHAADSALVTCMVYRYQRDHMHFVDANDGGYAMAARQLKRQLAEPAQGSAVMVASFGGYEES